MAPSEFIWNKLDSPEIKQKVDIYMKLLCPELSKAHIINSIFVFKFI